MNIERALQTSGWMSELELSYIADRASRSSVIVEIGSWRGRSAVAWAQNTSGVVYCIDTWDINAFGDINCPNDPADLHSRPEWLLREFMKNTAGLNNIIPIRTHSAIGAQIIAEMGIRPDTIFIDAGHEEWEITSDIEAWLPLLAEGGVLCGHDYGYEGWKAVKTVVDKMIPQFKVIDTIWTTEA